jgi:ribosomal-protein-alanine N-acetyltransferase
VVARPPVTLRVEPMTLNDLPAVQEIERLSFTTPWPPHAYRTELESNRLATYLVVREDGRVVAYAGMWLMVDEAHVTTFAVHPLRRRRHIAERLLMELLDLAIRRHAREATLEVRLSNIAARRLYEKYGFRPVGIRPRYYTDDNEDALIMTTEELEGPAMSARLARLRAELEALREPADRADERGPDDPVEGVRPGEGPPEPSSGEGAPA